jgi:hypothetical protein
MDIQAITEVTGMPNNKQDQVKGMTAQDFENAVSVVVDNMNNRRNSVVRFTRAFYAAILIVAILTFSGPLIGFFTAHYDYFDRDTRVPIASLADSSVISGNIHGNFLMTNGYITENPYFYYYSGSDRLKLERVPSSNAVIMRDEEISPYLLIREHLQTRHTWFTDMGWDKPITSIRWECTGKMAPRCGDMAIEYEFHVPKNSIVEPRYNLDTNMNT